jgi:Fe-S oxidoreductase
LSDELKRRGIQIGEVVEDCCWAGGGVYLTKPDKGLEITRNFLNKINSDVLVTGCPFCKDQLEKLAGHGGKIVHYINLYF